MGSLATLPAFAAGTLYTHSDFNAAFAALTIAAGAVGTNELAANGVTLAKLQQIAQYQLLARTTAGAGNVEAIAGTSLGFTFLSLASAAAGRSALGLGTMAIEAAADYLAKSDNLSGLTDVATARSNLGLLGSNLNSNLAASIGITLAGTTGADRVFNAVNAPTVQLTAGTWLVIGSVCARTSDITDHISAVFHNSTDTADFGGGASRESNSGVLLRLSLHAVGVVTVADTKDIHFKVKRVGASTLDLGNPIAPAGFIQAIRLTT